MKKVLLTLAMVSILPMTSVHAEWRDYVPSVPFWNSTVSENKEDRVLTEKEQLIQSAKKYAYAGAGLLALFLVLKKTPIMDLLHDIAKKSGILDYNYSCNCGPFCPNQYGGYCNNRGPKHELLYYIYYELRKTLISVRNVSKVASLACFGKAGYDLVKAQCTQSDDNKNNQ